MRLAPEDVLDTLLAAGIELSIEDGRVRLAGPGVTAELVDAARAVRPQLLDLLRTRSPLPTPCEGCGAVDPLVAVRFDDGSLRCSRCCRGEAPKERRGPEHIAPILLRRFQKLERDMSEREAESRGPQQEANPQNENRDD